MGGVTDHVSWFAKDEDDEGTESGSADQTTSMFSQLEKTRADLEGRLGLDPLLQAYQLIQVYTMHAF